MNPNPPTPIEDIFDGRCHPDACRHMPFPSPHWREDHTCSHCGGVRPSRILAALHAGAEVLPTDKSYKIYVKLPEAHPDEVIIVGTANHQPDHGGWLPVTPELLERHGEGRDLEVGRHWVRLGTRGATRQVKCYLNHFSEAQALEFVRLIKAGKMNIGYPGRFYRPLAFGAYKEAIEKLLAELKSAT